MDDEEEEESSSELNDCNICTNQTNPHRLLLVLLTFSILLTTTDGGELTLAQSTEWPSSVYYYSLTTQDWRRSTRGVDLESRCSHEAGARAGSIDDIGLSVNHPIFNADIFTPSISYQISISPGRKVADYSLWVDGKCLIGSVEPVLSRYNYTAPSNRSQVTFKLRYRLVDRPVPYQLSTTKAISQGNRQDTLWLIYDNAGLNVWVGECRNSFTSTIPTTHIFRNSNDATGNYTLPIS